MSAYRHRCRCLSSSTRKCRIFPFCRTDKCLSFRLGRFCTSQHASIWPDCIQPSLLRRFIEMPEPTTEHGPPHRYADIRRFVAVQSQTAYPTRTYCPYPALRPERSSYGLYSNTKSISFEGSLRHPRTRCTTETTVGRTDIRATRLSRLLRSADHRDCKTSVY